MLLNSILIVVLKFVFKYPVILQNAHLVYTHLSIYLWQISQKWRSILSIKICLSDYNSCSGISCNSWASYCNRLHCHAEGSNQVTVYFSSEQLLFFSFAVKHTFWCTRLINFIYITHLASSPSAVSGNIAPTVWAIIAGRVASCAKTARITNAIICVLQRKVKLTL